MAGPDRRDGAGVSFETVPGGPLRNEAVLTVSQANPYYRAKMDVVLDVENSIQHHEIELTQARQTFRFPVKGKVTSVLLDPDNWYVMRPPKWVVPDTKEATDSHR